MKDKKKLLYASICMLIYVILNIIYLSYKGAIITNKTFDNIFNISIFVISLIGIVYFIFLTNKKIDLNKHSKPILIFSILFLLLNLISGILGIMVYSNLDKGKKREVRMLPDIKLEQYTNKWICLIIFIICMLLMFVVPNYIKNKNYNWVIYIIIFISITIPFRKQLIHDFKIFKEYFKEYSSLVLKTWLKSLLFVGIINIAVQLITNTDNSTNQQSIQTMFDNIPILVIILTTIYAPIVEELLFRGVFRKFLSNKYAFIIISGFTFGILHVIDDFKTPIELLYMFTYGTLGCFLASIYYKTNNLWSNISFHFLQNALAVLAMILLKFI